MVMWADNPSWNRAHRNSTEGPKQLYIFIFFLRSCLYGHTALQAVAGRPLQGGAEGCPVPHALASRLVRAACTAPTGVGSLIYYYCLLRTIELVGNTSALRKCFIIIIIIFRRSSCFF